MAGPVTDTQEPQVNPFFDLLSQAFAQTSLGAVQGSILDDPTVRQELDDSLRQGGDLTAFLKNHPNLTQQDYSAIYAAIKVMGQNDAENAANMGEGGGNPLGPIGDFFGGMFEGMGNPANFVNGAPSQDAGVEATPPPPPISPDAQTNAIAQLQQQAATQGIILLDHPQTPGDLMTSFAGGLTADSTPEDRAQAAALIQEFLRRNPDVRAQDVLGEGTAINDPTWAPTSTAQKGDNPAAIANRLGIPVQDLLAYWAQVGYDPDMLISGAPFPIPYQYQPAPTETHGGEQTHPESYPTPPGGGPTEPDPTSTTNPPGNASPSVTTDSTNVEPGTAEETSLAQRTEDYGGTDALINMILSGKGFDPSEIARLQSHSGNIDAINQLMLASGGITDMENRVPMLTDILTSPPSSASLRDMLKGMDNSNLAEQTYNSNPQYGIAGLGALLDQSLGGTMSSRFLNEFAVSELLKQLAGAQETAPDTTIEQIMQQAGYL